MALFQCRECGGRISGQTTVCPVCEAEQGSPRSELLARVRAQQRAVDQRTQAELQARYSRWVWVLAVVLGATAFAVDRLVRTGPPHREPVERYGALSGEFNASLSKALVAADARGCGQMRWQPVTNRAGNFRVFCSRDGAHWVQYRVSASGRVSDDHTPVDGAVLDALLSR